MFKDAFRAALFDSRIYRDMDNESESVAKALGVVALAAAAFGIGIRNVDIQGVEDIQGILASLGEKNLAMLLGFATVLVGWALWAAVVFMLSSRVFLGKASYRMLLRGIGIASGPGILMIFLSLPGSAGATLFVIGKLWMLAASVFAVRELQQSNWYVASGSVFFGWLLAQWVLPGALLS